MTNERTKEIIAFAQDIRRNWGSDAIEIAEHCGINVVFAQGKEPGAHIIKSEIYPTIITITGCDDYAGSQVLCAHELGHALLHETGVNWFDGTYRTIVNDIEHEANLFAVALLFDENDFNIPLEDMSNYALKSILDYNLRKRQ